MEILKNIEQINEKLIDLFGFTEDDLANEVFLNEIMDDGKIKSVVASVGDLPPKKQTLDGLRELIFQLGDYLTPLCNLIKMLLYSKNYELIFSLVTKLFVGQIGKVKYTSKSATNFTERYFDRFIEIVKNCKIPSEAYIPLIASIFKSNKLEGLALWKNPALEYLQNFYNENEEWLLGFISSGEQKYDLLDAILHFNSMKGVSLLIENFVQEKDEDNINRGMQIIKENKRDVLNYIDREMINASEEKLCKFTQIMLAMDNDPEVISRLKDLYERTELDSVKELISVKWGISETMNLKTEKQFLYAVRRKIKDPQERTLGIPFDNFSVKLKSGYPADNAVYTFLIYLFKEEKNLNNLQKLSVLKMNIFDEESLNGFARRMFENLRAKQDINQAKWCIRMFTLFADDDLLKDILEFLAELFKADRNKEAKYLSLCLIYCGKVQILDIFKRMLAIKSAYVSENLDFFVGELAKVTKKDKNEFYDALVPENYTDEEYQKQRVRLYDAFISGRLYTKAQFENLFIKNPIYNALAQNLVFGEYKFGRLHNAFVLQGDDVKFLIGSRLPETDDDVDGQIGIGIVHSLDCDFRYEKIYNYFENPTFQQFKHTNFEVGENRANISVNRFMGTFVGVHDFIENMQKFGFRINKTEDEVEFSSLVYEMPTLNILVDVEFEKKINLNMATATVGAIRFYYLDDVLKAGDKAILEKANALSVSAVPYRFYDYVLSCVNYASTR